jgi:sterol desaturase/sphingolipid hydroxylase (fatty acid hydroxylase superfamily)
MDEARAFGRSWWCRGGGAAVSALLAVVAVHRNVRDVIFWAAVVFFLAHTVQAIRRYLRDRRLRTTATVIRHHRSQPPAPLTSFIPMPVNSLVRLEIPPK